MRDDKYSNQKIIAREPVRARIPAGIYTSFPQVLVGVFQWGLSFPRWLQGLRNKDFNFGRVFPISPKEVMQMEALATTEDKSVDSG